MSGLERPYTLKQAVAIFLGPPWTVSSLRTEIRKGRLVAERIAGKLAVTESAIARMRELCRESANRPASTSDTATDEPQCGSSSDSDLNRAQAAAKATLQALKENSLPPLPRNTSRRKQRGASNVLRLPTS